MNFRKFFRLLACGAGLLASACTLAPLKGAERLPPPPPAGLSGAPAAAAPVMPARLDPTANAPAPTAKIAEVYPARGAAIDVGGAARVRVGPGRGDITLNFESADLRAVIDEILDDLLRVNYIVDPEVRGSVTIRTARPISRQALIPTLEAVLAANNAVLLRVGDIYRVAPASAAGRGGAVGVSGGEAGGGFSMRVVPLDYVAAAEMQKIAAPLLPEGRIVVDEARNLLIVRGTSAELEAVEQTVEIFDVDRFAGTAMLIESFERVDVATVVPELENIFGSGKGGPLAGIVRFMPIERLNAVLVMTTQPRYLDEVRNWIARLDRAQAAAGRQLFVYYVQNGRAADLAKTLTDIFTGRGRPLAGVVAPAAAPGPAGAAPAAAPVVPAAAPPAAPRDDDDGVRIVADEINNALLIRADRSEFGIIQDALARLDIMPLQVLIEANILEVTLRDLLRFGVQYFFNTGGLSLGDSGKTILSATAGPPVSMLPGFSFTLTNGPAPKFIIDTLAQLTEVNMLSSPQVLVLDNQPARLLVGDQVPIATQIQQSTFAGNAPLINSIEYRDTGVALDVRPRVNASGLVTLEITQEVSDVTQTTTSQINSPTIRQRKIASTVAVTDGATVVLGGLIRENNTESKQGIPVLNELPVIGPLFGAASRDLNRTELLVLLTPRVVRNEVEARDMTRDISRRYAAVLELREIGAKQPRRFAR